jgi:hypothetical protein
MGFELGALFGTFVLVGLLPGAFVAYGRSNRKAWASGLGIFLCLLFALGSFVGSGGGFMGPLLGVAFVAYLYLKPRKPPPIPEPSGNP